MNHPLPDPASYVNFLNIPEGESGSHRIKAKIVPPGTVMDDVTQRAKIVGGQRGQKFRFDEPTRWHQLLYSGGVWMTDLPIEQRQMREASLGLVGRVLVGGLGLGLLPTILGPDPMVEEIVIVEKSPDVIKLVAKHVLRDWPACRKKLTFVKDDLFKYLLHLERHTATFDSAFFDIWQSDGQSEFFHTIVPLLKLAHASGRIRTRPLCWNEDVMRGQLQLTLLSRLHFQMYPELTKDLPKPPTVKQMARQTGSIWTDWHAPFWARLVKDGVPVTADNRQQLEALAETYSTNYGDPWKEEGQ